jgi:hypothetical protein
MSDVVSPGLTVERRAAGGWGVGAKRVLRRGCGRLWEN